MKIHIENVINDSIQFSAEYGQGRGKWKSDNPPIKKDYYVEFDIDAVCNYTDFLISSINEYQIKMQEDKNVLTLLLVGYDELGCATFRIGNSLIEIETEYDNRFLSLVGSYLIIKVEELGVYDENILERTNYANIRLSKER